MSFSNHLVNIILDCIFGDLWYSPQDLWLGLSRADPLNDGSGLNEPWLVQEDVSVAPEPHGGYFWLKAGSWHKALGGENWDPSKGSYIWQALTAEEEEPAERGGFPDQPSGKTNWKMINRNSGYHRVWLTPSFWYWASMGVTANAMDFPFPTALGDWEEITHWALFDAWSMTMFGELSPHKTISAGQKPCFYKEQLEIFLS